MLKFDVMNIKCFEEEQIEIKAKWTRHFIKILSHLTHKQQCIQQIKFIIIFHILKSMFELTSEEWSNKFDNLMKDFEM